MEHLVAPRRSSVHPSLLAAPATSDAQEIPLADYVVAMFVDLPHWTLYDEVSKDLQDRIEAFKEFYRKAEEDVKKDTPDLFREFVESDDSFKEALIVSSLILTDVEIALIFHLATLEPAAGERESASTVPMVRLEVPLGQRTPRDRGGWIQSTRGGKVPSLLTPRTLF